MQTKNLISLQVVLNFITCIESVFLICFRLKVQHSPIRAKQANERITDNQCIKKTAVKKFFLSLKRFTSLYPIDMLWLKYFLSHSFEFNVRQLREL